MPFPHSSSRKCGEQDLDSRLPMGDPHRPRLAKHATVLGSGRAVISNPSMPDPTVLFVDSTVQLELTGIWSV